MISWPPEKASSTPMMNANKNKREDPRTVISVAFRLTVGGISAIGAAALIFAFWMWPRHKDLIVFAAACIGGAAAVAAAIYRGKSLELSATQQRNLIETEKRLGALRLAEQWNSPAFSTRRRHGVF